MTYDPYLIPGTDTLQNIPGYTDREMLANFERRVTSARAFEFAVNPIKGDLNFDHLKQIHHHLFQDVFAWAGEIRTVGIDKGDTRFEWPERIEHSAERIFCGLRDENHLEGLDRVNFIDRASHYLNEINVLHPFREGNGRAQRAFLDHLSAKSRYVFDWHKITAQEMIDASIHGYAVDTSKLVNLLGNALTELSKTKTLQSDSQLSPVGSKPRFRNKLR